MCVQCGVPFDIAEEHDDDVRCVSCLDFPPSYNQARTALRYDDVSRGLLLAYKHGDKTHMALPFSRWMMGVGQEFLDTADVIVPVPLHWTRLFKRRYNQAALLAQCLAKKSGVAVDLTSLRRVKRTLPQGHMNRKARAQNVRNAFEVSDKNPSAFLGKSILLIDDVFTTGETVDACAKILLNAGAVSVNVLCVARTVYD